MPQGPEGSLKRDGDYYPFGLTMAGISSKALGGMENRYKFGGKELSSKEFSDGSGMELYDFQARNYDPQIGRWWSNDPMADKSVWLSPYNYCLNNPLKFFDPDGKFPYPIQVRSFAPYKTFGGGFSGDNRGYSTSSSATSRLAQSFTMDPSTHSYSGLRTGSSPSHHPILGTATAKDDRGSISSFTYKENKDGSNTVNFTSTMAGHNPLVPGSPDIDVKTNFTLTENTKAGTLNVKATQTGDAFPSAETLIGDTKGNQLFIGVSPAQGDPYTSLPGDNDKAMMSNTFTITMNKDGVFTGVQQGDKSYSIAEWNKMMQAKPVEKPEEKPFPPR